MGQNKGRNMGFSELYDHIPTLDENLGNLKIHSKFIQAIIGLEPEKLLEVGTGTGGMSVFLSHIGYEVTSIDNDDKVLRGARELSNSLNSKVEFVKCDAFELDKEFGEEEFDIVFSQGFFEHFDDTEIKRLLNQQLLVGDIVVFSVPSENYPYREIGNERLLSIVEWKKILKDYDVEGFEYASVWTSVSHAIRSFFRRNPTQICLKIGGRKE